MTTLQLTKHHGLGNDFLVAFHPPVPVAQLPALAVALCDRRTGIGADGLLIAESASLATPLACGSTTPTAVGPR
jgi:diaminopimelate epimerase